MSSIDSIQQIVATIRAEMTARITPGERQARATQLRETTSKKAIAPSAQRQPIGTLIRQRVKALDPDDPGRGRKTFRIFLESVLLTELGDDLINDPAFLQMVEDVQLAMEKDPQIAASIKKAVDALINT
jgi:hypothetical protein